MDVSRSMKPQNLLKQVFSQSFSTKPDIFRVIICIWHYTNTNAFPKRRVSQTAVGVLLRCNITSMLPFKTTKEFLNSETYLAQEF